MTSLEDLGLKLLLPNRPGTDSQGPRVDIVAVHGVNGHYKGTWSTSNNYKDEALWLSAILPNRIPNARVRVMSFGYRSNPRTGLGLMDAAGLRKIARDLLRELHDLRISDDVNIPIVFIGHNLGGVVIKELLWVANNERIYLNIAVHTKLLVFFGTPVDSCPWVDTVFNITLASTEEEPVIFQRREILKAAIQKSPGAVRAASARFYNLVDQYEILRIFERKSTPFVGMVVSDEQVAMNRFGERHSKLERDTDHLRLCRFSAEDDGVLNTLCEKIMAATGAPVQDGLYEYLECRLTITTLYPEVSEIPTAPRTPITLELSAEILAKTDSIIHVYGRPGSGISVLSAHLAELASENSTNTTLSFQFSRYDSRRKTFNDLLLSFLRQLLFKLKKQSVFQSSYVRTLYKKVSLRACRTPEDLWSLFRAMLATLPDMKFVCIVDAIDECDSTRKQLLGNIVRLQDQIKLKTPCKFIITSCVAEDVTSYLEKYYAINLDEEASMKTEKELFIDQQTQDAQLLHNIQPADRDWCTRALPWLVFSTRPLTVEELTVAVAMDSNPGCSSVAQIDEHIRRNITDDLWRTFGTLLRIEDNEIHLVHRDIKEFLVKHGELFSELDFSQASSRHIHGRLASSCLRYLCFDDLSKVQGSYTRVAPQLRLRQHSFRSSPNCEFLDYAALHWATHVQKASSDQLLDQVQDFLQNSTAMKWWSTVYWALKVPLGMDRALDSTPGPTWNIGSPLKVAAHLGLAEIVEKLLKSSPESYSPEHRRDALVMAVEEGHAATVAVIFQTGGLELEMGVLALKKACEFGRESVVEWVLDFWKDPEYRTGLQLDTCLCSAAKFGHAKIARLLIDAGSDVNTTSDDKRTPLMLAAEGGYEETVLELLEAKADVEVKANILYVIRSWNESCQITALQLAASSGHIAALQALLHVGNCSVDETTFGTTALHMAAKAGHGAIVQELLNKGANPELASTSWQFRPLHYAAWYGHGDVIRTLLNFGAEISPLDDEGLTPLAFACVVGKLESVKALLCSATDADRELPSIGRKSKRPLHFAAAGGHALLVRALLESGVSEDPVTKPGKETPLHLAVESPASARLEVVNMLLEYEVNVNKRRENGDSALHVAVRKADVDVAEALLRAKADFTATDSKGKSPLHIAAAEGGITASKMISLLVKWGADINQLTLDNDDENIVLLNSAISQNEQGILKFLLDKGVDSNSVLHTAVLKAGVEALGMLLTRGADVTKVDQEGCSPLFQAVASISGSAEKVKLLLDHGCDPSTANSDGKSVLHHAAKVADASVLETLLTGGANVTKVDQNGCSPLFQAAASGSAEKVKLLLDHGCDPNLPDKFGRLPCDVAHWPEIRVLLSPAAENPKPEAVCPLYSYKKNNFWIWWSCSRCEQRQNDLVFYHCCLCSSHNCQPLGCFDICNTCRSKGIGCKSEEHHLRARFYGGPEGMISCEEYSPAVREFGLPPAQEDSQQMVQLD